jgi:hypothetical protein
VTREHVFPVRDSPGRREEGDPRVEKDGSRERVAASQSDGAHGTSHPHSHLRP